GAEHTRHDGAPDPSPRGRGEAPQGAGDPRVEDSWVAEPAPIAAGRSAPGANTRGSIPYGRGPVRRARRSRTPEPAPNSSTLGLVVSLIRGEPAEAAGERG